MEYLATLIRSLTAHERLAAAGAVIVGASMLLPWYGVRLAGGLVKTPLGTFGLIEAALLLTVSAAGFLIVICPRADYSLPRPLDEGSLLVAAGAWSSALIAYRVIDRPDFELPGAGTVGLRYGIFIAAVGAALLIVGGMRKRREQREARVPE